MEITDIHSHLYHPDWYPRKFQEELAAGHLRRRGKHINQEGLGTEIAALNTMLSDRDGSVCLRIMDKVGIQKRVLHVLDWGLELGEASCTIWEINRAVLNICQLHNDRLTGFAGVDPRRPDSMSLLTWAFNEMGASGLKLHPTSRGWTLADERTLALVNLAAERNLPVMVHTGETVNALSDENCQPSALLLLAAQFPRAKFIAGHSGFSNWRAFGSTPPDNLWFDVSAWQERLSLDGEGAKADMRALFEAYPHRVFFGTDSPFYGFNMSSSEAKWIATVEECAKQLGMETVDSVFSGATFLP